jgi:hypothetical protein
MAWLTMLEGAAPTLILGLSFLYISADGEMQKRSKASPTLGSLMAVPRHGALPP